eukprot:scpid75313/ scgid24133/ E3 ubiquitin-protein ligase NRDP1; RING finger protein 41
MASEQLDEVFTSDAVDRDRFSNPVSDSLCCVVCYCVPTPDGARQCSSDNQHLLCKACARRVCSKPPRKCPMCRCDLARNAEDLQRPSRLVRNMYSELQVKCSHCEGSIVFDRIEEHERKCTFGPNCVQCCFNGCGVEVPRFRLAKHMQLCSKRIEFCKTCFLPFAADELHEHNSEGCTVPPRFRTHRRGTALQPLQSVLVVALSLCVLIVATLLILPSRTPSNGSPRHIAGGL